MSEKVNHPKHYQVDGDDGTYEAIRVIETWKLGFNLGNTVKYISRVGKKDGEDSIECLEKALWYLQREIQNRKTEQDREKPWIEKINTKITEDLPPKLISEVIDFKPKD